MKAFKVYYKTGGKQTSTTILASQSIKTSLISHSKNMNGSEKR